MLVFIKFLHIYPFGAGYFYDNHNSFIILALFTIFSMEMKIIKIHILIFMKATNFFSFLNKEAYTPDKLTNKRTQRQIDRLTDGRTLKEHKATTKHMDK